MPYQMRFDGLASSNWFAIFVLLLIFRLSCVIEEHFSNTLAIPLQWPQIAIHLFTLDWPFRWPVCVCVCVLFGVMIECHLFVYLLRL